MGDIKDIIKKVVKNNKGEPISSFKITTDSQQTQLEPIYYWILDFIQDGGWKTEKIVDTLVIWRTKINTRNGIIYTIFSAALAFIGSVIIANWTNIFGK